MDPTPLAECLGAGRYLDVLLSNPAGFLITDFVSDLLKTTTPPPTNQTKDVSVSAEDKLSVGLAAFNAFLQANVTGPVLDDKAVCSVQRQFLTPAQTVTRRQLRRACLHSLDVDGVSVYEHIPLVELFCLARYLLASGEVGGDRARWLALRVRVWHYKLLTQPSLGPGSVFNKGLQWCDVPSLQGEIEEGMGEVEAVVMAGEGWSVRERVQFLVEKANVCIMLGQDAKAKEVLKKATELSGFVYALSGALAKRTRFQEKSTSQLVVLAKSREAGEEEVEQAKPQALKLNDDTLLEQLDFTKETPEGGKETTPELPTVLRGLVPDEQPQLAPLDQIILLAEATLKDAFSPTDSLTSEEVLPFAVRVISDKSTNWQIYTHALLVRSRIEVHRSRTMERGVLQMQAVVDQVIVDTASAEAAQADEADAAVPEVQATAEETTIPQIQVTGDGDEPEKPSANKPTTFFPAAEPTETAPAQVRLEHIHALSSPPRWHLESELAYSWAGVGSLVSALEIFKRLRLWAEVALCFASAAATEDEDGRGSNGEAKAKAVLRWRLFHKTGTPAASDEVNEEVNVDDLKVADYQGPERQPAPPNAPRLWCILGDMENDPAHYERAWEISQHRFARAQRSLGEYYLQQREIERAREAYKKAVVVNRLSSELWNRLGDIELRLGNFSEASDAFGRAIASSDVLVGGEDARTWSNLGSALYSLYVERVKELKKAKEEGQDDLEQEDENTRSPSTLLTQSLAAYKRGANISRDNWRIWDNVVTLAARLRPPAIQDLLVALRNIVRIRATEDALDLDVLRLLLNEGILSKDKSDTKDGGVYDPPRGTTERAVCEFLEKEVVPLITARSELWELVARERVWRRDYGGAVDAAERAWRAAVGVGGAAGGLLPSSAAAGGEEKRKNWLEDKEAWGVVVERTEELVSVLENYGEDVPEIGTRWKGKARSAIRSVMGKAKENWEGSDEWERLVALLEGLQ